jgi:GNAT superfamily N-acetyltransferase
MISTWGIVYRRLDKIVGFITYFSHHAVTEIAWMAVHPELHRQQIGKELIQHLKSFSKKSKCCSLLVRTLDESIEYPPYERTRAFFLKNGFKKFQVISHPENPECKAELVLRMDL